MVIAGIREPPAESGVQLGVMSGFVGRRHPVVGEPGGEGCDADVEVEDAERALIGKPLNEQTATEAAEAAVRAAQPLNRNGYKVQIARTSVKRAIMQAAGNTAV